MRIEGYEYQSDFAKKYIAEGKAKGRAEGEAKGRAEGKAEGEAKTLLKILALRNLTPTEQQRQHILSCRDPEQLDRWMKRALEATSFSDLLGT